MECLDRKISKNGNVYNLHESLPGCLLNAEPFRTKNMYK